MKTKIIALLLIIITLFCSCNLVTNPQNNGSNAQDPNYPDNSNSDFVSNQTPSYDDKIGNELDGSDIYNGEFDGESDLTVTCVSGTENAFTSQNGVLTFTALDSDSVYSISGRLNGYIVIDIGSDYKLELEFLSFSLVSAENNPITILSANKVSLCAKKEHSSYIYDKRDAISEESEDAYSGAIYSLADLEICGKGELTVVSENNNGIHSKKDLEVKNLSLTVVCKDNALKGNDSVSIKSGKITLIATQGDGIKTTNSDISSKGKQRGTVSILGGEHNIYAACDGIDAAYNVTIDGKTTTLNIYTDKYSSYSESVTAVTENVYYIRYSSSQFNYSVKYYNSDDDFVMVNAEHHSTVSGSRSSYYYYSFPKMTEYSKMKIYIYTSDMKQGSESNYYICSDYLTPNISYDTFALINNRGSLGYTWTNYTTNVEEGGPGGFGGMNDGNNDKGSYSTKGIKAANEIIVSNGIINIKSYDDAIHANSGNELENSQSALGNVTINGGSLMLYSNDDGIHADYMLSINGGNINVANSYEGLEGYNVTINSGDVSIISRDDGINATATQGTSISVNGGKLFVYASGDGIDSNSRASYSGIAFCGGNTVIISTSGGNSAIDSEQGYSFSGGRVLALMPSNGMTSESTHCTDFSSIGTKNSFSVNNGEYLSISVDDLCQICVKMPCSLNGTAIYLGSTGASISNNTQANFTFDENGIYWN